MRSLFTRKDYDLLPEGFPAQRIEGFLLRSPAPTYGHQGVVNRLLAALFEHVPVNYVHPSPLDVILDGRTTRTARGREAITSRVLPTLSLVPESLHA